MGEPSHLGVTDRGAVYFNGCRITFRGTKYGGIKFIYETEVDASKVRETLKSFKAPEDERMFEKIVLDPGLCERFGI